MRSNIQDETLDTLRNNMVQNLDLASIKEEYENHYPDGAQRNMLRFRGTIPITKIFYN